MSIDRRAPLGALALCLALAALTGPLAAKDVYKGSLDPSIPQHRATLDLLARLEKTPNDAALHNDLACLIARDGFWRDALREFLLAAKLDKTDGRPLYNAGLVHATRGEWGSAASSFRKAVSRGPGNWTAWWMLGYAEERRGNDSAAIAAYKTSLRVDTSLFDVRRNPFAAYTRLKGRVLLETLDGRLNRAALPAAEQMADAGIVGSFQPGGVTVSTATGGLAPGTPAPGAAVPAGGPATDDRAVRPGPGGAVVTSVPPVSTSRPAPPPNASSAPATPSYTKAGEIIPSDIPEQSPAGPARKRTPAPGVAPGAQEDAPAPTPAPTPVRAGPGIG